MHQSENLDPLPQNTRGIEITPSKINFNPFVKSVGDKIKPWDALILLIKQREGVYFII